MGHMIQCFIGHSDIIQRIVSPLEGLKPVIFELPQGLQGLFLCNYFCEAIYQRKNTDEDQAVIVEPFDFFDCTIKEYLEEIHPQGNFIYIETEYFGGTGTQTAGIFKDGFLTTTYKGSTTGIDVTNPYPERLLDEPINKALRSLGVIRDNDKDEFDTVGLPNHKYMPHI